MEARRLAILDAMGIHAYVLRPALSAGPDWPALAVDIRRWGKALGFQEIGIAGTDLESEERRLIDWLAAGRHGAMDYMARHGAARTRPAELVAGTLRVITARMNYRPPAARASEDVLDDPAKAFIARYALGRDYHKVLRSPLARLAERIEAEVGPFGHRAFTDSAPVLEAELAVYGGLADRLEVEVQEREPPGADCQERSLGIRGAQARHLAAGDGLCSPKGCGRPTGGR